MRVARNNPPVEEPQCRFVIIVAGHVNAYAPVALVRLEHTNHRGTIFLDGRDRLVALVRR